MSMKQIRIATRKSNLALWQARHVKALIEARHADVQCELVGMMTEGDVQLERQLEGKPSRRIDKGVFVRTLEQALLDGSVDLAVHSMKDLPGDLPEGLMIAAICARADPRDALVANRFERLEDLPQEALIGSSSLRRRLQIGAHFPHLRFADLRGNVETRLSQLDEGRYDALVLAVAGLERLQLGHRITQKIPTRVSLPAAGQGAVGIESRADDAGLNALLSNIGDSDTQLCVSSERLVTQTLGATCDLPIAVFAHLDSGDLSIAAFVADIRGETAIHHSLQGQATQASQLALTLAEDLIDRGAQKLIAEPGPPEPSTF